MRNDSERAFVHVCISKSLTKKITAETFINVGKFTIVDRLQNIQYFVALFYQQVNY